MSKEAAVGEDVLESAYWCFDAKRKGNGMYKGRPMAERDAFKAQLVEVSKLLTDRRGYLTPAELNGLVDSCFVDSNKTKVSEVGIRAAILKAVYLAGQKC